MFNPDFFTSVELFAFKGAICLSAMARLLSFLLHESERPLKNVKAIFEELVRSRRRQELVISFRFTYQVRRRLSK
jgi:hypothetical protein